MNDGASNPERTLATELRRAMIIAGQDRRRLAIRLGWAPSRVSRLLLGLRTAHRVDVAAFLAVCGVTGPARERLLGMCVERGPRPDHPGSADRDQSHGPA